MRAVVLAWVAMFLAVAPVPARAAPDTPHFRFDPEPGAEGLASHLAGIAEDKRHFVLGLLGVDDPRVLDVRIAVTEEGMERMVGSDAPVREWIAGMAFSGRDLIVMSARGNELFRATDTFVHELAHIYLDSVLAGHRVPRWFHEGFAMLVASEEVGERLKTALTAAATGSFFPIDDLADGFPVDGPAVQLAYAQSMLFVRWIQRVAGGDGIRRILGEVRTGMPFDLAFDHVVGGTVADAWKRFSRTLDPVRAWIFVLTGAGVIWSLILGLFLVAYWRKRRRAERRREAWELEERIAQASWAAREEEVN